MPSLIGLTLIVLGIILGFTDKRMYGNIWWLPFAVMGVGVLVGVIESRR